eukprot:TRINITY_DN9283_c0_g1_i3.p1 TRINITY_DN9283_c0_g1~~TRINITY_DN9283_c0_g1_i3.p1  ORF type:complete len:189 (-),score=67.94 TRINITY_DN9283_c0_g1_i3:643-1209(-)
MSLVERRIPSLEVGEYCEYEDRRGKYLFPLEEEGSYGPLPQYKYPGKWMEPQGYTRREKKPKVYASYAINSDCAFHGPKLERFEREPSPRKTPPRASPPKSVTTKVKRASSLPPESTILPYKPVGQPKPRMTSVPPTSPTPIPPELDDLSELTGRLRVTRAISQDIEDSLIDRSTDDDETVTSGAEND